MDAVVLAGGFATRLWPVTKNRAKPLLPLGEKPIIDYLVEEIEKENRVDRSFISINKKFKKDFETYLDKNNHSDIKLVIEDSEGEEEKLGALGALYKVIEENELEGPLLVVAGDNYISFNISCFLDFYEEKKETTLAAYEVPLKEASSFGVLDVEEEKVVDFNEKPENPTSNLVSIGFYVFSEKSVEKLEEYIKEGENPDAPGYFLQWLINKEEIYAFDFNDTWFDIGTPENYLEANKAVLKGDNVIIDSSINNDSNLKNTYINKSVVQKSDLNNCILFEESKIKKCKLNNVIVDGEEIINQEKNKEIIK